MSRHVILCAKERHFGGRVEGGIHLLASMSSPVEHEVEIVSSFCIDV